MMHHKTFNIAAICIVVLLVVFTITHRKQNSTGYTNNIQTDSVETSTSTTNTDDDYHNQVLQTIIDQSIKSFETTSESFKRKPTDTLSDTIAKNTFAQYIDFNTTDSLNIEKITSETLSALKEHPVEKSNISINNITLTQDNVTALRTYGNEIGTIQTEVVKAMYKIRTKKEKGPYIASIYKTAARIYMKTPVPESLTKEHLGIINGYLDYAKAFDLLALQNTDPAKALSGVQLAKESQDLLIESFSSVKKIVLLNNIVYKEGEPAYVWFIQTQETEPIKLN